MSADKTSRKTASSSAASGTAPALVIDPVAPTQFRLAGIGVFDVEPTFRCGQCFRWRSDRLRRWTGLTGRHAATLEQPDPDTLFIECEDERTLRDLWIPYLDLARDYGRIERRLCRGDAEMRRAIGFAGGLHLLAQDPWEMLVTWLVSQNNGIPRITGIIDTLCRCFGEPFEWRGQTFHAFPTPQALASLDRCELDVCRAGYRRDYIHRAAVEVSEGRIDPWSWRSRPVDEVRAELLSIHGVGAKVADCTLLFSGLSHATFPVDRWVLRVMTARYPGCGETPEALQRYAAERFGDLAGFAQEYLFHDVRMNGLDSK